MTERTFVSQTPGPIVLGLSLPVGHARVEVSKEFTTARIELHTDDASGPAADAIHRTRSHQDGQALAVEVPELPGNVMVQSVRGNRVTQSFGTVRGSVTGLTIINGRVVSGGSSGMQTVSAVEVTAYLPAGSSLAVVSTSADAAVFGYVEQMEFRSVSGDLDADGVNNLVAKTTSGDVSVGHLTGRGSARTVSGDIDVHLYSGQAADLHTTSGDIDVQATPSATGAVQANTVSGDALVSGARHLHVDARSMSGHARTR
ncbi:DUF4097 family beta strand repeat-containing protein [Streptomyces sp. NPDC058308]|uniref:DUF4097 family beta strand repeat-containing protein n=1 Tax=Streptomyces sp. NPDC058308 TaxID=3346440 RepID=UPI0036E13530